MAQRRLAVITILICLCFWLLPCYAMAASTTEATEAIDVNKDCTLTLSYVCDGTPFADMPVKVYKVAEVSADFQYTLTDAFAASGLALNGIRSTAEWNTVRSTLEAHSVAENITADVSAKTDSLGQICELSFKPGLYLVLAGQARQGEKSCFFESALVALPGLGTDGCWQYQVSVISKSVIIPPSETDEEIPFKVVKLWKGDEGKTNRPKSVEVEIFRDGVSFEKVVLSQETNWVYHWSAKQDGANWTVAERNIPDGYTVTVEERDNSFVLTNAFVPQNPEEPFDKPQTGETTNIMLYVVLMIASGCMLVIFGMIGKRNAHDKSN